MAEKDHLSIVICGHVDSGKSTTTGRLLCSGWCIFAVGAAVAVSGESGGQNEHVNAACTENRGSERSPDRSGSWFPIGLGIKRWRFELGGLPERELEKLKQEAERLGKGSFAFAFYMDRQKEERERGVTISCTTKESAGRISGVARTAGRVFVFVCPQAHSWCTQVGSRDTDNDPFRVQKNGCS